MPGRKDGQPGKLSLAGGVAVDGVPLAGGAGSKDALLAARPVQGVAAPDQVHDPEHEAVAHGLEHAAEDGPAGVEGAHSADVAFDELLGGHLGWAEGCVGAVVVRPVAVEDAAFAFELGIQARAGQGREYGHEGGVDFGVDGELDGAVEDAGVVVVEAEHEGADDGDAVVVEDFDEFFVLSDDINALADGFEVFLGKGLQADEKDSAASFGGLLDEVGRFEHCH